MKDCYVCKVEHDVDGLARPGEPGLASGIPHRVQNLDGLVGSRPADFPHRVTVYRGQDGVPVVEIDTYEAEAPIDHAEGAVPYVRIYVNDAQVYGHSPDCDVCGEPIAQCECLRD